MSLPEAETAAPAAPAPAESALVSLTWGRRWNLRVFDLGLACCAIEFLAASLGDPTQARVGARPLAGGPAEADVLVISGTVTDKLAPAIRRIYDLMPEPRYVVSFGSCSNCGGPYWDSYSVTKGVDQIVPVDVFVPGCPPRPEALLQGIRLLEQRLSGPVVRPVLTDRVSGPDVAVPASTGLAGTRLRPVGPADLRALLDPDPADTDPVDTDPVDTDPVDTDPVDTDPA